MFEKWPTDLRDYLRMGSSLDHSGMPCGVHIPTRFGEEGEHGCAGCPPGRFGPIYAALCGDGRVVCRASLESLEKDVRLARVALDFGTGGVCILRAGRTYCERFKVCLVLEMKDFGAGYCYLHLFAPNVRLRVARILGPLPLLVDVLRLYVCVGLARVNGCWLFVNGAGIHLSGSDGSGGVKLPVDGVQIFVELARRVSVFEGIRIGIAGKDLQFTTSVKEMCRVCKCMVVPFNHEFRCQVRGGRVSDPGLELLGDAAHSLDVKLCVVAGFPVGSHFTVISSEYVSAFSQSQYMKTVGLWSDVGWSDHTWGNEFELKYKGRFRREYLAWLRDRLCERDGCVVSGVDLAVWNLSIGFPLSGFDCDDYYDPYFLYGCMIRSLQGLRVVGLPILIVILIGWALLSGVY